MRLRSERWRRQRLEPLHQLQQCPNQLPVLYSHLAYLHRRRQAAHRAGTPCLTLLATRLQLIAMEQLSSRHGTALPEAGQMALLAALLSGFWRLS